ncbi:MAG TPA: hypothetical protein VMJ10_11890 [Kofleriaceae bacterium]|nr:hypothetical protein [Kofleriaceae bacterium]
MRWLVALALASCYSPELGPCDVRCGQAGPCPAGLACGDDNFCHASTSEPQCTTLSLEIHGSGTGEVTSMPKGVDCNSDSSGTGCDMIPFQIGTAIELTESHDSGNSFAGWIMGACVSSTAPTCDFTIEQAMTVQANFDSP